jgi:large subunit ribosomal protein L25
LQGIPVGLQEGGVLQQNLHRIEVECLPAAIPQHIDLEVSSLIIGDSMFVRDLVLPVGVTLVTEGETAVVTLVPPEKVEVPVEVAPVEGEIIAPGKAVEVEGKEGKPA